MISTKAGLGLMAAGALAAAAVLSAPAANAGVGPATTRIYWTGTNCINVTSAQLYNPRYSVVSTLCGGSWVFSEGNIWSGDLFGADPIMGSADYIECQVSRDGYTYSDSAFRGDGTDVSCLRREL